MYTTVLVGGFNPSKKYKSNWKSSTTRGENLKELKPPPRYCWWLKSCTTSDEWNPTNYINVSRISAINSRILKGGSGGWFLLLFPSGSPIFPFDNSSQEIPKLLDIRLRGPGKQQIFWLFNGRRAQHPKSNLLLILFWFKKNGRPSQSCLVNPSPTSHYLQASDGLGSCINLLYSS